MAKEIKKAPAKKVEVKKIPTLNSDEGKKAHAENLMNVKKAIEKFPMKKSIYDRIDNVSSIHDAIAILKAISEEAKEKIDVSNNLSVKHSLDCIYSSIVNLHAEISNEKNTIEDLKNYLYRAHFSLTSISSFTN